MKISTRRAFLQASCLGGLAYQAGASLAATPRGRFTLFDGLLYKPMPDLRSVGMPKALNVGNVWRPGIPKDVVDPIGMAEALRFIQRFTSDVYFDLEEWTLYETPPDVDARIARHLKAVEIARATTPGLRFGFYGVVPTAPYWPIILNETEKLSAWHALNKRSQVIAAKVDYLFPSLYTFYDDPKGWEVASRVVLEQARQYGKPLYPFLWHQYHDSNAKLRFQHLPPDVWRRELEFCHQYADGAVLWGGINDHWDEEAPWWLETKAFLKSLNIQPLAPTETRVSRA